MKRVLFMTLCAAIGVACAVDQGGDKKTEDGTGGSGQGGSGNFSGVGGGSSGGSGGGLNTGGVGNDGGGCQQFEVVFEHAIPTVLLFVDRSGSMFDGGYWEPLKTAALKVVEATQSDVRYGLLTFTGIQGQTCPLTTGVSTFALGNYSAIQTAYEAASVKPGQKLETPTAMTLNQTAIPDLLAVTEPGPKYILFVTDGEPDRCDDGTPECARDDVVGAVQSAYSQGIQLFVFGLGPANFAQHLQDVANAGAGAPVGQPGDNALYACFAGNWANSLGTYAPTGASTKYFTPDPTDALALQTALETTIDGVKSCTFDLQGKIEVDLENADKGKVTIDGVDVPFDATNGWSMSGPTQLVLNGAACDALKQAKQGISFDFPCEIFVPR